MANVSVTNDRRQKGALRFFGLLVLVAISFMGEANGFQAHIQPSRLQSPWHTSILDQSKRATLESNYRSRLTAFPVAASATVVSSVVTGLGRVLFPSSNLSKVLRAAAFVLAGVVAASPRLRQRIFWPGLTYPEAEGKVLPGSLGCPFVGSPFMLGNKPSYGAGSFYRTNAAKLAAALGKVPKIWKYYFMGVPFAVLSGGNTFQKVISMEFTGPITTNGIELLEDGVLPTKTILFEEDKKRHSYLRRLVGLALTPSAVAATAPTLQSAAEEQVAKMLSVSESKETIKFQQVCTDYTLDVAWRQILGLELPEDEIPYFEEQVATWIEGIMSLRVLFKIAVKSTPAYKAKEYLVSKIEERIDELLEQGPDHKSTLSGMVFATDEEGESGKKLSRQEIIENALILILAGSETSANTLTNAMLFLGLHPSVWEKLVAEQKGIQEKYGDAISLESVDANNAPYLDAVLKESLRLRTVVGAIPRKALQDIDVDGDGKTIIPKGFLIDP